MTLVIGIAGGTGSGKTTVAKKVESAVPIEQVNRIEHDSYYRDRSDLTYEQRCGLNFDHPSSLETSLFVEHVRALKAGQAVEVPGAPRKPCGLGVGPWPGRAAGVAAPVAPGPKRPAPAPQRSAGSPSGAF